MSGRQRTTSRFGSASEGTKPAQQAGPDPVGCLLGTSGVQAGRIHALGGSVAFLGSDPAADVFIDDPSVAPRHARIVRDEEGYLVEDLGSDTGTFVDSQQILRARLRDRSSLALGAVDFTFLADMTEVSLAASTALVPATFPGHRPSRPWPQLEPPSPAPEAASAGDGGAAPGAGLLDLLRKALLVYGLLRRYWILLAVAVTAGVAAGAGSMVYLPPAPLARCEIKLDPQIKANPVEERHEPNKSLQYFQAAALTLPSTRLVASTLEKLGIENPDEWFVANLAWRIGVEPMGANLYSVTYQESRDRDTPRGALTFLDAHVRNYVEHEIDKALKVINAEVEFLRGQRDSVLRELDDLNRRITSFRERHTDALPEQASGTLSSRFELESRQLSLQSELRRVEGELEATRRQLHGETAIASSRIADTQRYKDGIADINRKLSEARSQGLGSAHPTVLQLNEERRQLEALVAEQLQTRSTTFERQGNLSHQHLAQRTAMLEAQRGALEAELRDVRRGIARAKTIVGEMPRVETTLLELTHQQAVTQRLADQLFEKLRTTELQLELERVAAASRFEIVTQPKLDPPRRKKTLMTRGGLGVAVMLLLAALVIAVRELRPILLKAHAQLRT